MEDREAVIWEPSVELQQSSSMEQLRKKVEQLAGNALASYSDLQKWAVQNPARFWPILLEHLRVLHQGSATPPYLHQENDLTPLAPRWFPNLTLSFAENLLMRADRKPSDFAIISRSENVRRRVMTQGELQYESHAVYRYLQSRGISPCDRTFGYMPCIAESVTCMLGSALSGATWSSCGTDYMVDGLLSRIERVQPSVLYATTSYLWRGKDVSLVPQIIRLVEASPSIKSIVLIDPLGLVPPEQHGKQFTREVSVISYEQVLNDFGRGDIVYARYPFSHPLYVMFSSGTTGRPKGIVHSAGGTLFEHLKELELHADIRSGDTVFYHTSTSWMMWNWIVSSLACPGTLVLFDGDPMSETGAILWRIADEEKISHFGTSASYLSAIERKAVVPKDLFHLGALRAILSTGSTLHPDQFDYVSQKIGPIWIQSISGGTDIIGCFGLGNPLKPVLRGEVQGKSLGYDVRVFKPDGAEVIEEEGELVCTAPAPSMPVSFLDDDSGTLYREAYFSDFPGVWRHGDFVIETKDGGLLFLGRSDATLKPGGVRVATADIYAALYPLPEIVQALAVGYTPKGESVERIALFVVMNEPHTLTEELESRIKTILRERNVYYVPSRICAAPDLPRTTNNKLSEIVVKRILRGEPITNSGALANPESLEFFRGIAEQW